MALKPWYQVVYPRQDLREGRPLDASEFAVHLDQVRDKRAPADYQKPERFFERTHLTRNLIALTAEAVRRLSGITIEANAVFNMTTQFGGGKTHALTLLYHLASNGPKARSWAGVDKILASAGVESIPLSATAVFVGTEFDSLIGRGGNNGEPIRKTPWGEIAWQLGGKESLSIVAEHERQQIAPSAEVIRQFLPKGRPSLILMDELMNYVSRSRKTPLAGQLYAFLQNLTEEARGQTNVVLAVSIPASELEMSAEDHADYNRFKKLLDRVGKAVIMSAETETSEIIRRRLFEWEGLSNDAEKTISEFSEWVNLHRNQIPSWFQADHARDAFRATYPFHPTVLSVFERKWQELPRFQQTRGVLRLLALWVSRAYVEGCRGAHRDPLIGIGTAPLDDSFFRTAAFEQLGEPKLEGAVTTDICGKSDSHALRLDQEAIEPIKKLRLHRKAMTTIFFESNGGQMRAEATGPEIRLSVAEPDLDIGNIETVLESLAQSCYFLSVENKRYRISLSPNLNKLLSDRRASITTARIDERVRTEVKTVFGRGEGAERVFFPEKSGNITDRPALTLVVLPPEQSMDDVEGTKRSAEAMTREYGKSGRTFKSALIWCVANSAAVLKEEARKTLAWDDIQEEADQLRIDDAQRRQLIENVKRARRDLTESVWRTYNTLLLLGKDNQLRVVDLGLVHSSSATDNMIISVIIKRLRDDGDLEKDISPNFLLRKWPPRLVEWSTKAVRDAFFSSPQFPRLMDGDLVKETIARGVSNGLLAYIPKREHGEYKQLTFNSAMSAQEVEISEDVFIITAEEAKKHAEPAKLTRVLIVPAEITLKPGMKQSFRAEGVDQHARPIGLSEITWSAKGGTITESGVFVASTEEGAFTVRAMVNGVTGTSSVIVAKGEDSAAERPAGLGQVLTWRGDVPAQKWMNFYTKVLSKFATGSALKLTVKIEATTQATVTQQKIDEMKHALRELGLDGEVRSD